MSKYKLKKVEALTKAVEEIDPKFRQAGFDVNHAFELYLQLTGDVAKTAAALNVAPSVVMEMAEELKWNERLKEVFLLKKSGKPGDLERFLNRSINFVLASRYRVVLERIVNRLYKMDVEELLSELTVVSYDKEGNEVKRVLNTKALADLATAIEKMQAATFASLNDTTTERLSRKEAAEDNVSLGAIHQIISQSMADSQNSVRREEFAAKLAEAQNTLQSDA